MNISGVSQGENGNISKFEPVMTVERGPSLEKKVENETGNGSGNEISDKSIKDLTKKLDAVVGDFGVHAEYAFHDKLKDVMIKIVDDKTGAVVSEIPSKKILDMIAKFCEMAGIFVDKRA